MFENYNFFPDFSKFVTGKLKDIHTYLMSPSPIELTDCEWIV